MAAPAPLLPGRAGLAAGVGGRSGEGAVWCGGCAVVLDDVIMGDMVGDVW